MKLTDFFLLPRHWRIIRFGTGVAKHDDHSLRSTKWSSIIIPKREASMTYPEFESMPHKVTSKRADHYA